jgi:hypothetical protein
LFFIKVILHYHCRWILFPSTSTDIICILFNVQVKIICLYFIMTRSAQIIY